MTYNYGIIGCGAIARRGHLPVLKRIRDVNVKAICDIDSTTVKRVGKEFQIHSMYTDFNSMLDKEDLDVVIIATPTQTHMDILREVVKRGINAIVEKPLTITLEDAVKLKKLVQDNKVKVTTVQNYRYIPVVLKTKSIITKQRIGKPLSILGTAQSLVPTSWTKGRWLYHKGGVLYDYFPHLVDIALWLFNFKKIQKVYAVGGNVFHSDFLSYAHVLVTFDDETYMSLETSWLTGTMLFELTVRGTSGWNYVDIRWNHSSHWVGVPTPIDYSKDFIMRMQNLGVNLLNKKFFTYPLLMLEKLHRDFINNLRGRRSITLPTIEDAVYTTAVLSLAYESIKTKKAQTFPEEL